MSTTRASDEAAWWPIPAKPKRWILMRDFRRPIDPVYAPAIRYLHTLLAAGERPIVVVAFANGVDRLKKKGRR